MKKRYDAVATVGKYTNKQTGEEKKRYLTVGVVFEDDQGRLSMKLDALPTTQEWSGWISFYEPKDNGQRPNQDTHNEAKSNGYATERKTTAAGGVVMDKDEDFDDDIPF